MPQQEKQHAHEKEMRQQKLQREKNQQRDVNVVHLQEKLREEQQQENLLAEEEQREDDADLFLFFFNLHLIQTVNYTCYEMLMSFNSSLGSESILRNLITKFKTSHTSRRYG